MHEGIADGVPLGILHRHRDRRRVAVEDIDAPCPSQARDDCEDAGAGADVDDRLARQLGNVVGEEEGVGRRRSDGVAHRNGYAMTADLVDLHGVHGVVPSVESAAPTALSSERSTADARLDAMECAKAAGVEIAPARLVEQEQLAAALGEPTPPSPWRPHAGHVAASEGAAATAGVTPEEWRVMDPTGSAAAPSLPRARV